MKTKLSIQSLKYVTVSSVGAFLVTGIIANLLNNHFEGAIVFNWLCAVYLLRSDKTNTYHYAFIMLFSLLIGGIVFAVAMAPFWLFTTLVSVIGTSGLHITDINPIYLLIANSFISSLYMLIGSRRIGFDPAKGFM